MIQSLVKTDHENQRLKCQRMNCELVSASDDFRTSQIFTRASHEFVPASQIHEHTSAILVVRINDLSTFQFQDLRMQQRHQWGGQRLYNRNFKKCTKKIYLYSYKIVLRVKLRKRGVCTEGVIYKCKRTIK